MAVLDAGSASYKLKRRPAKRKLKADIQTRGQFMKINVLVSVSSSGKVPIFLGVGVDPCMFGKCLTDTWLKCAKGRKKNSGLLQQLVSLTQPLKLQFSFAFLCPICQADFQRNP